MIKGVAVIWDIVAVTIDEDATLKWFMKMGDTVLLFPENYHAEKWSLAGVIRLMAPFVWLKGDFHKFLSTPCVILRILQ